MASSKKPLNAAQAAFLAEQRKNRSADANDDISKVIPLCAKEWIYRWVGPGGERGVNPATDLEISKTVEGIWWVHTEGFKSAAIHTLTSPVLIWESSPAICRMVRQCGQTTEGRHALAEFVSTSWSNTDAVAHVLSVARTRADPRVPVPFLPESEDPAVLATRSLEKTSSSEQSIAVRLDRLRAVLRSAGRFKGREVWEENGGNGTDGARTAGQSAGQSILASWTHIVTGLSIRASLIDAQDGLSSQLIYSVAHAPDAAQWRPAWCIVDTFDRPMTVVAQELRDAAAAMHWMAVTHRVEQVCSIENKAPRDARAITLKDLVSFVDTDKSLRTAPAEGAERAVRFLLRAQSRRQVTPIWISESLEEGAVLCAGPAMRWTWNGRLAPPEGAEKLANLTGAPAALHGLPYRVVMSTLVALRQKGYVLTEATSDASTFFWSLTFHRMGGDDTMDTISAEVTNSGVRLFDARSAPGLPRASWKESEVLCAALELCAEQSHLRETTPVAHRSPAPD